MRRWGKLRKPHQSSYVCDDYSDESVMNNWFLAKALELFLGMIIEEAYKVTAERGSKKVEAYHLCVVLPRLSGILFTSVLLCIHQKKARHRDDRNAGLPQGDRRNCPRPISWWHDRHREREPRSYEEEEGEG